MAANGLFESAMKGRWDEVVAAYEKNPSIRDATIPTSEDTLLLHLPVSNGRTEVVSKLVELIGENGTRILHKKRTKEETHLSI